MSGEESHRGPHRKVQVRRGMPTGPRVLVTQLGLPMGAENQPLALCPEHYGTITIVAGSIYTKDSAGH